MEMEFIKTYDDAIDKSICNELIGTFETSKNLRTKNDDLLKATELFLPCPGMNLDLYNKLVILIRQTYNKYKSGNGVLEIHCNTLEQPRITRYEKNQYINIHADTWNLQYASRQVGIIIYLNDVNEGGNTIFPAYNLSIKPVQGRILMFPSFYTHVHRGEAPVSNSKYILATWIHFDPPTRTHQF